MINDVLVLGGGSAGFIAALTLKMKVPRLNVTVVRSKDIGIIGVGEGTTLGFPKHMHGYLGLDIDEFYRNADPQWKIGVKFLWGPRDFSIPFRPQMTLQYRGLAKEAGYYCRGVPQDYVGWTSALMAHDRVFARLSDGNPAVDHDTAYHIENEKLVEYLESHALRAGVVIREETVQEVLQDEQGIAGVRVASGEVLTGDLYLDCSGFYSVLLGKTLKEPFLPFKSSLFCDRAVVGGWKRGSDEPIQPYTVAETMDAGWCWRIDHEFRINRGYVYSSSFISDADAETEYRRKCPKVEKTRVVKFVTGRYARSWVKNVVAIGNASGFVEPLQATSLWRICDQSRMLAETLEACEFDVPDATKAAYCDYNARAWDSIRNFLAIHYRFNTRLDTPFWRECRADVELGAIAELTEYFQDVGPSSLFAETVLDSVDLFGIEGYLAMLVGMQVPYRFEHHPTEQERQRWSIIQDRYRRQALAGFTVEEALRAIRSPTWRWPEGLYQDGMMPCATGAMG